MTERLTITAAELLANDVGRDLRVVAVGQPEHGSTTYVANTIVYTAPEANITTDAFTYTIRDSYGQTATANVVIDYTYIQDGFPEGFEPPPLILH